MNKHVHKYLRVRLGKDKKFIVFRCVLTDCPHFIRREFIIGKRTICWRCGAEFVMTAKTQQLKPHCHPNCDARIIEIEDAEIERSSIEETRGITSLLEEIAGKK